MHLIGEIKNVREQHEDDFLLVKETVDPDYDLQDFEFYFDYLCRQCELLKPLWDE